VEYKLHVQHYTEDIKQNGGFVWRTFSSLREVWNFLCKEENGFVEGYAWDGCISEEFPRITGVLDDDYDSETVITLYKWAMSLGLFVPMTCWPKYISEADLKEQFSEVAFIVWYKIAADVPFDDDVDTREYGPFNGLYNVRHWIDSHYDRKVWKGSPEYFNEDSPVLVLTAGTSTVMLRLMVWHPTRNKWDFVTTPVGVKTAAEIIARIVPDKPIMIKDVYYIYGYATNWSKYIGPFATAEDALKHLKHNYDYCGMEGDLLKDGSVITTHGDGLDDHKHFQLYYNGKKVEKEIVEKIKKEKVVYVITLHWLNSFVVFGVFSSPKKAWKMFRKVYRDNYDMNAFKALTMEDRIITYQPSLAGFKDGFHELTATLEKRTLNENWKDYIRTS